MAEKLTGFLFYIHSNLLDDPMNPITQPTQIAERLTGFLFVDKKEKEWYLRSKITCNIL